MSWERGCSMEACEKISHIFYVLLALFAWNLDVISSSPLFWQPLAPVCCDSPRKLLDEFRLFLREKWTPISSQFTLGNLNIISMSSIWQSPRASVYGAFGRISHIFNVLVDSDFPAQFALENLDIISTCTHMAVGRGFSAALTHFSRTSGLSRS